MTVAATVQLAYGNGSGVQFTAQNAQTFQDYTEQDIDQFFSTSNAAPTAPIPFGMAVADVSGNGIPGLVLNGYLDTLQPAVMEFEQSGGEFTDVGNELFPNGISFNVNFSSLVAAQLVATDLNGDGFDDVAAVDPNVGQVMLLTTSDAPLADSETQTDLVLGGGALPQFAVADFSQDGYPDLVVPGANDATSQSAPVIILNGTINVGTVTITPTNGETLVGQNFADINFSDGGNVVDDSVAGDVVQPDATPVSSFSIGGLVYLDRNQNGRDNVGEPGLSGLTLYIDTNRSGQFDPAIDPSTTTDSLGYYSFTGLALVSLTVSALRICPRIIAPAKWWYTRRQRARQGSLSAISAVAQRWSIPQTTLSVYPLSPMAINLSSISLRESLAISPRYTLVGVIPAGMTINSYTGQILWTPPMSDAGMTIGVSVRIENSAQSVCARIAGQPVRDAGERSVRDYGLCPRRLRRHS